ncbi:hypothetical protein SAMN02745746_04079 [Pseudogulbenkiania subflava DSM 22618]|uniref:Uncharacterized protein n=1 Tax=Pseudogulbenkiania subflava DSM 22618 TaxID=1123014 RepID=A0A1Y6CE18_9NEIS|nr:hypothetical protein SAMN02745746_04079 [Pseudogulbenkiania subflava DSM 22618]
MKSTKSIKVSIKSLVLRVPLQIKGNTAFNIINLMAINKISNYTRLTFITLNLFYFTIFQKLLIVLLHSD